MFKFMFMTVSGGFGSYSFEAQNLFKANRKAKILFSELGINKFWCKNI